MTTEDKCGNGDSSVRGHTTRHRARSIHRCCSISTTASLVAERYATFYTLRDISDAYDGKRVRSSTLAVDRMVRSSGEVSQVALEGT